MLVRTTGYCQKQCHVGSTLFARNLCSVKLRAFFQISTEVLIGKTEVLIEFSKLLTVFSKIPIVWNIKMECGALHFFDMYTVVLP